MRLYLIGFIQLTLQKKKKKSQQSHDDNMWAGQLTLHTRRRQVVLKCCHHRRRFAGGQKTCPQSQPSSSLRPCSRSGWTWPSACMWTLRTDIGKRSKRHIIRAKSVWFPCCADADRLLESSRCGTQHKCDRCLVCSQGRWAAQGNLRTTKVRSRALDYSQGIFHFIILVNNVLGAH